MSDESLSASYTERSNSEWFINNWSVISGSLDCNKNFHKVAPRDLFIANLKIYTFLIDEKKHADENLSELSFHRVKMFSKNMNTRWLDRIYFVWNNKS